MPAQYRLDRRLAQFVWPGQDVGVRHIPGGVESDFKLNGPGYSLLLCGFRIGDDTAMDNGGTAQFDADARCVLSPDPRHVERKA